MKTAAPRAAPDLEVERARVGERVVPHAAGHDQKGRLDVRARQVDRAGVREARIATVSCTELASDSIKSVSLPPSVRPPTSAMRPVLR